MIRLLLTCLGVAALQLGAPRAVDAAELGRSSGPAQSIAPRLEAQAFGAITRDGTHRTEVDAVAPSTPGPAAQRPHLPRASAHLASPTDPGRRSAPASHPRVLPDARAPPA